MRKTILAAVSFLAIGGVPFAVEASPSVPQGWSGFYAGAHVGGAWLDGDMTAYTPYNGYTGFSVADLSDSGVAGGLQLGYNYQMGNVVFGITVDGSLMNLNKSSTNDAPSTPFWRKLDWTATLAPRLGYSFDDAMVYGKAGLALGGFTVGHNQNGTNIESSSTGTGYVLGAGVEYALAPNWTMDLEYNYMNFGSERINVNGNPDISIERGGDVHAVNLGLNYRF